MLHRVWTVTLNTNTRFSMKIVMFTCQFVDIISFRSRIAKFTRYDCTKTVFFFGSLKLICLYISVCTHRTPHPDYHPKKQKFMGIDFILRFSLCSWHGFDDFAPIQTRYIFRWPAFSATCSFLFLNFLIALMFWSVNIKCSVLFFSIIFK